MRRRASGRATRRPAVPGAGRRRRACQSGNVDSTSSKNDVRTPACRGRACCARTPRRSRRAAQRRPARASSPLFSALRTWLRTLRSSAVPLASAVLGERQFHRHLVALGRQLGEELPRVPQLEMRAAGLPRLLRWRAASRAPLGVAVVGEHAAVVDETASTRRSGRTAGCGRTRAAARRDHDRASSRRPDTWSRGRTTSESRRATAGDGKRTAAWMRRDVRVRTVGRRAPSRTTTGSRLTIRRPA